MRDLHSFRGKKDTVTSQLSHGSLERSTRARGWIKEDHTQRLTRQPIIEPSCGMLDFQLCGQIKNSFQFLDRPVLGGNEMFSLKFRLHNLTCSG